MDAQGCELLNLGRKLKASGYRFVTVTPETHARINARPDNSLAQSIEGILGWSRWFRPEDRFGDLAKRLQAADCLESRGDVFRSRVRFSSVDSLLFVHSAFPTSAADAVFFGPDTYRFVRAIRSLLAASPAYQPATIVDIGAGSGCGGLVAAHFLQDIRPRVLLTDVNPLALSYSEINAGLNDVPNAEARHSDILTNVAERADLFLSNPPYLQDAAKRTYRHGGDHLGTDLSLRILEQTLSKLPVGGRLLLYTGVPVIAGADLFWRVAGPLLAGDRFRVDYDEIDPDVFGEELESQIYSGCDRIAAVQLLVTRVGN